MIYIRLLQILVFLKIILLSEELESTPTSSTILRTEAIIRSSINSLFTILRLGGMKDNLKIRQNSLIHDFFTSLALRDHGALRDVSALAHATRASNSSADVLQQLHEVLLEDSLGDLADSMLHHLDVITFIHNYLEQQKFMASDEIARNVSKLNFDNMFHVNRVNGLIDDLSSNETGDAMTDTEVWVPTPRTRRIFKGQNTKVKFFPFMASVHVFQNFQCGGSIIHSDLVVTAASCLQLAWNNRFFRENPTFLSVRVGSNYIQFDGEIIGVQEVYFHPAYNPKNLKNNVAIIRLQRHLKFNHRRVKKIEIDRSANDLPMNTDGITIVGWGAKTRSNILDNPWSNRLSYAILQVYSLRDCQEVYSKDFVSQKHFCAGFISRGSGACNKDAGDPGVVAGKLSGVVNFGSAVCGTPDAPTVFTKLGHYTDWINGIVEMKVEKGMKETTLLMRTTQPTKYTHPWENPRILMTPIPEPISSTPVEQGEEFDQIKLDVLNELLRKAIEKNVKKENSKTSQETEETSSIDDALSKVHVDNADTDKEVADLGDIIGKFNYESDSETEKRDLVTERTKQTYLERSAGLSIEITEKPSRKPKTSTTKISKEDIRLEKKIRQLLQQMGTSSESESDVLKITEKEKMVFSSSEKVTNPTPKSRGKKHKKKDKMTAKKKDNEDTSEIKDQIEEGLDLGLDGVDPSVLTLLYLSENEKKDKTKSDKPNKVKKRNDSNEKSKDLTSEEGISIDEKTFKDLTFRNKKALVSEIKADRELYELLNEAISNKDDEEDY